MGDPIIIRHPTMSVQSLDAAGAPTGSAVDISPDVAQVTLTPTVPQTTITTFAGKFTATDDPEWGAATVGIVVNEDTATNWAPLVGDRVQVKIFDRGELTWWRQFESEIIYNPALAGITQPGSARTSDYPLPVLSGVTIEETP